MKFNRLGNEGNPIEGNPIVVMLTGSFWPEECLD